MARDQRFSDERLAEHLAAGQTVAAAARAAGMSERSAYRRKKQPAVRARIAEVRRAALDTASARLDHGMVTACDRLIGLLGHANPHVQIRAAQTVIQLALKVRHEVDAADQLDAIAEPTRRSPVVPEITDPGAPPADPERDRTDRAAQPQPPEPPTPDVPSPAGIALATGGDDRSGGVELAPPPAPAHPGGLDRRSRPGRTAHLVAVVGILLLLAGLRLAFASEMRARGEGEPAADRALPTCQNLTEPATAAGGHHLAVAARYTLRDRAAQTPVSSGAPSSPFPVRAPLRGGRLRAPDQLAELGPVSNPGQIRVTRGAGG